MTSSISPDVSRNSGMVGWIPSAKGRCRSATPYLRLRNGGAFARRLCADFVDGMTLRAIEAEKSQTTSFCWRLFCESVITQS